MKICGFYHDAAHRVVTLPFAVPVDAHVVANGGRRRCVATESPQMPTVGAGSSQREDSPARSPRMRVSLPSSNGRPLSPLIARCDSFNRDAAHHVATNTRSAGLPLRGGGSAGRPAAQGAAQAARGPGVPPPPAGGHLLRSTTTMRETQRGVCSDVACRVAVRGARIIFAVFAKIPPPACPPYARILFVTNKISINHLQLFEDRSGAASRVIAILGLRCIFVKGLEPLFSHDCGSLRRKSQAGVPVNHFSPTFAL